MARRRRGGASRARRQISRHLPVRVVPRDDGGSALEVGGVVQSVYWPSSAPPAVGTLFAVGYWELMVPQPCPRTVLLLGLGGGTVAWLLARRCPGVEMTGIEVDPLVLATARADLALDDVPGLTAIQADAFAWVAQTSGEGASRFDLVAVDLFDAGRLVPGTLATPFLRQIASLVAPDGLVVINLALTRRLDEQRHRIERVFTIERERRHLGNIVIHARPRPSTPGAPPQEDGA